MIDRASSLPGYQAGYRAGRRAERKEPLILTQQQKDQIVREWLVTRREQILEKVAECDRNIALLTAEEELRKTGFLFPAGYSSASNPRSITNDTRTTV